MKITVLGCGASGGVPFIFCECPVCKSDNPKNKRTRVSILVESEGTSILVDTSPDMRAQCLAGNLSKVDAIIFTHMHADHIHGIDDVRSFNYRKNGPIEAYGDAATMQELQERFGYVFKPASVEWGWNRPCLVANVLEPLKPVRIGAIDVMPFEQWHGKGKTLGLRFGKFAYSTDTNGLSDEAFKVLAGVDTWIVDCLRRKPAPTHAHVDMALGWIEKLKPRQAYLTHMNHEFDYDSFAAELPKGVAPAYDGLVIEV